MDSRNRTGSGYLPGTALPRDTAAGEHVEKEIDQFVGRGHDRRVGTGGERDEEAARREAVRRHNARRQEENRFAWCDYCSRLIGSLGARAEEYDQRAALFKARGEGAR